MRQHTPTSLRVILQSRPETVRHGLRYVTDWLGDNGHCSDLRDSAEIVLAEIINNVVEHAYADETLGMIEIALDAVQDGFTCAIRDNGVPMPGGAPPDGSLPDIDVDVNDLPEGGFGWYMIRTLVEDLAYDREAGQNNLTFKMRAA